MLESIIQYIYYAGLTSGLLLIVLLLLAIFAGADTDLDADIDTDASAGGVDTDAGLGIVKSILTMVSIACLSVYSLHVLTEWSPVLLVTAAILIGFLAVYVLSQFFRWLISQQESGNWHIWEALHERGKVYIPIPENGKGKVIVEVDGIEREIDAISEDGSAISTYEEIYICETYDNYVSVMKTT